MLKRYWNVWVIAVISAVTCFGLVLLSYQQSKQNKPFIEKGLSLNVQVNKHAIQLDTLEIDFSDGQLDPKAHRIWDFVKKSEEKFEPVAERNTIDSVLKNIPFFKRPKEMTTMNVKVYKDNIVVVGNKSNTGELVVYTYNQATQESKQIALSNVQGYALYNSMKVVNDTVSFVVTLYDNNNNTTQHVKLQTVSVDIVTGDVTTSTEQIFENGAYAHTDSQDLVTIIASEKERYVYNVVTGERITLDNSEVDSAVAIDGNRLYGIKRHGWIVEVNLDTKEERELAALSGRGSIGMIDEKMVMSFDEETQTLYGHDIKTGEVVYQAVVSSESGQKFNILTVMN